MRYVAILILSIIAALPVRAADTLTLIGQDVTYTIGPAASVPPVGEDEALYSADFLMTRASVLAGTNTLWFDVWMSADSDFKLNSFAYLSVAVSVNNSASQLMSFYALVGPGEFTASSNLTSDSGAYGRNVLTLQGSSASSFAETGITFEGDLYTTNSDGGAFGPGAQTATLQSSVQVTANAFWENRKGAWWRTTGGMSGFGLEATVQTIAPVPEPEIYASLAIGLGLLGWLGRRKYFHQA